MADASQVSQNKRGRDEYWNDGMDLPDSKRINGGLTLAHEDSDLMALLDQIDNLDANHNNAEYTDHAVNELESEMRLNGVIESLEDEIGLKTQTENKIESADQMGSLKLQGELTVNGSNSEATGSLSDIVGDLTYYHDVRADLDFFVEHICCHELGMMIDNYIDGDSTDNNMYWPDAVHGYAETTEDFYESLWEHDI